MKTLIQLFEENAPEGEILAAIAAGVDVNAKDYRGNMPLHYAVENKNGEGVVRALHEVGADVSARDNCGRNVYICGNTNN